MTRAARKIGIQLRANAQELEAWTRKADGLPLSQYLRGLANVHALTDQPNVGRCLCPKVRRRSLCKRCGVVKE